MDSLNDICNLGFTYQPPSLSDHTHFFARHIKSGDEFIWLVESKNPKIYYEKNYSVEKFPDNLLDAFLSFVVDLGYSEVKFC